MTLFFFLVVAILVYYFFVYRDGYKNKFIAGSVKRCPNCHNPIEGNFNVCPICKETLKKKCVNCGGRVETSWKYCPYCEKTLTKSDDK